MCSQVQLLATLVCTYSLRESKLQELSCVYDHASSLRQGRLDGCPPLPATLYPWGKDLMAFSFTRARKDFCSQVVVITHEAPASRIQFQFRFVSFRFFRLGDCFPIFVQLFARNRNFSISVYVIRHRSSAVSKPACHPLSEVPQNPGRMWGRGGYKR